MTSIALTIAGWVLPIALGPIVYLVAREVLNAHAAIDNAPPIFKRIAVVALGTLVVAVLNVLGVAIPPECVDLPNTVTTACAAVLSTPTIVRGVTAAVVAMGLHFLKKSPPNA